MEITRAHDRAAGAESTDPSAPFREWIEPHWPAMRRLAERLAGPDRRDDVLQEALTAAWRHRSRFDPRRGTVRVGLLGITANKAKKALRAASRRLPVDDAPGAGDSLSERLDLQHAVRDLPRRQRIAVELYYFVGLPLTEVAAVMGCAEGTAKSTIAAARTNLRDALGQEYRS